MLKMRAKHCELFALICVTLVLLDLVSCNASSGRSVGTRVILSREFLLSLRDSSIGLTPDNVPVELCRLGFPPTHRKRGRRGGVRRRLKYLGLDDRRKHPPLPSVLLSNVQSIRNKMDELEAHAKFKKESKETCLLAFTETWLSESDLDSDVYLSGFGCPVRLDRSRETTGKKRGGGVCFYVNQRYCNSVTIRERICTTDIELLSISLRPYYLPREFQQLFFTLVYIHPRADASAAAQLIADVTLKLDSICPDAPKFILGDFNHCVLSKTLRHYEQYVKCPTTQKNTALDLCYGSVNGAYKAHLLPSFGASYHNSVYLTPVYKPSFRRMEREERTVKVWSENGISTLQASLECTNWNCFFEACDNIDELSDAISSYITFCVDSAIETKNVTIYPNNKPWVTKDLKSVINKKRRVFYLGDTQEKKNISREVRNEARKARINYKNKIERLYSGGNLRAAWSGIKSMASVNQDTRETRAPICVNGVECKDLPKTFNSFYARFERPDTAQKVSEIKARLLVKGSNNITITQDNVTSLLKRVNVQKAAGPDYICGRTLRHCADQLGGVFSRLFQMSVDCGHIPVLWKTSTIVPVPKFNKAKELNDYRPIALTSLVMKSFEKILKNEIVSRTSGKLDPLQFAYQTGKGVDDAKIFLLDKVYKHLEKPKSHARVLFADFSSAFNKVLPHILIERLALHFNLPNQILLWVLNFLTDRVQRVLVNGQLSDPIISNTGSPQGCVLSALLFIMYTDTCRSSEENRYLIKFSDDTVLLSLLQGPENGHGKALSDFVEWCDNNFLDLNVQKTKEMIIDFRKSTVNLCASMIHGEEVESVTNYKYLGTVFDSRLKFDLNTDAIIKKSHQRIYLLRKLNHFSVSQPILCTFYRSFIESLLTFSFICWFHNLSVRDKNSLNNIVKLSSKIIGVQAPSLNFLCNRQVVRKARSIADMSDHILNYEFSLMPSGRRYLAPVRKTNRYSNSFIPVAIRLLNSEGSST